MYRICACTACADFCEACTRLRTGLCAAPTFHCCLVHVPQTDSIFVQGLVLSLVHLVSVADATASPWAAKHSGAPGWPVPRSTSKRNFHTGVIAGSMPRSSHLRARKEHMHAAAERAREQAAKMDAAAQRCQQMAHNARLQSLQEHRKSQGKERVRARKDEAREPLPPWVLGVPLL